MAKAFNEIVKEVITNPQFSKHKKFFMQIDGLDYSIGFGEGKYCDSLNKVCLMDNKLHNFVFDGNGENFFYITPSYKMQNIKNRENFEWVGEFKSKFKNKEDLISFGFGKKSSGLTKYTTKDFK